MSRTRRHPHPESLFLDYDPNAPVTADEMAWAFTIAFKADTLFRDERLEVLSIDGAVLRHEPMPASEWLHVQQQLRDHLRYETDLVKGLAVWFDSYSDALIASRGHVRKGRPSAVVADAWGTFDGYAVLINRNTGHWLRTVKD